MSVSLWLRLGIPHVLVVRVRICAPDARQVDHRAWSFVGRCSWPAASRGHKRELSGFLVAHPVPLPCSKTPAEPERPDRSGFPMLPPHPTRRRLRRSHDFEAYHRASVPAVYASRVMLPSPMQDSLPAGGLRLCREGVEPSGSHERFQVTSFLLSRTLS
jgi:hypothetical protein